MLSLSLSVSLSFSHSHTQTHKLPHSPQFMRCGLCGLPESQRVRPGSSYSRQDPLTHSVTSLGIHHLLDMSTEWAGEREHWFVTPLSFMTHSCYSPPSVWAGKSHATEKKQCVMSQVRVSEQDIPCAAMLCDYFHSTIVLKTREKEKKHTIKAEVSDRF